MRNYTIDKLRFFAALGVVLIHVTAFLPSEGKATLLNYHWYRPILNLSVPFFFAVSGYILSKKSRNYMKGYLKRILAMFLSFSIFYIIKDLSFYLIDTLVKGTPFFERVDSLFEGMTIETLLDGTFGKYHLWFLTALFMAGILFYVLSSWNLTPKELFFIGTLLYLISMLEIFTVSQLFSYGGFPKGLFYITMGYYIGKLRSNFKPSLWYFFSFLILYVVLSMITVTSFINLLLAPATFFLMLFVKTQNGRETIFSKLGTYSLEIYILHVFIIESYELLVGYFPTITPDNDFIRITILTVVSVVFSIVLYEPVKNVFINPINGIVDRIINIEKHSEEI